MDFFVHVYEENKFLYHKKTLSTCHGFIFFFTSYYYYFIHLDFAEEWILYRTLKRLEISEISIVFIMKIFTWSSCCWHDSNDNWATGWRNHKIIVWAAVKVTSREWREKRWLAGWIVKLWLALAMGKLCSREFLGIRNVINLDSPEPITPQQMKKSQSLDLQKKNHRQVNVIFLTFTRRWIVTQSLCCCSNIWWFHSWDSPS